MKRDIHLIRKPLALLIMIASLLWAGTAYGQTLSDNENLLIRNVRLIDRDGKTEDAVVSILIKGPKLDVVTKDEISLKEADLTLDAKEGILLGNLELGQPANFMIVDEDPRENINSLLDTKAHTVFAIITGKIAVNTLLRIEEDADENIYSGWLLYDPPPVALPLSYQNNRKWNVFITKPVNILLIGALLLENTRWLSQDEENNMQVGDLSVHEGGSIRGLRIGVGGTINFKKPWNYAISGITNAYERGFEQGDVSEFILGDYRLSIPLGNVSVTLGKQKEPISMQRITGMVYLPDQQERTTPADALMPARNVGITFNGNLLNSRMSWAGGVYNRWFDVGKPFSQTASQFIGRVTGLPWMSEDESSLVHLGFGGRYTNAKEGIRYKARTEIYRGPLSVDTELFDANHAFTYVVELAWRRGPLLINSEIMRSAVNASAEGNPNFGGYFITAAYTLTGEMRPYNKRTGIFGRLSPAKSITSGGWGSWSLLARWSTLNLNDANIEGGKMSTISLGVDWWAMSTIQVSVNYRYSTLDRYGTTGSNHGMVTRLVLVLE